MKMVKRLIRKHATLITIPNEFANKQDCEFMTVTLKENGDLVYSPVVV